MTRRVFKSFRPNKAATLMLFLLTVLFCMLGSWQARRSVEKSVLEQQHRNAPPMALEQAIAQESRFARISIGGHYDARRHLLLDNQIWQGRAGVYVFTPFHTDTGATILVNRGWLPLAPDRKSTPEVPTPTDPLVLRGILNIPPVPGRMLGASDTLSVDTWPQLVTYLNIPDLSELLDMRLENWVIQLSETESSGFEGREWKPVFLSSTRHRGYAVQWFALAAASIVMWLLISFRNPKGNRK